MRFFSNYLNALALAASRPLQDSGDDSLHIPSLIMPSIELSDQFTLPSLFAASGDSQSGLFGLTHSVANGPQSLVPIATLAKGYYDIKIVINYTSNYLSTNIGTSSRDHVVMIGNPTGNISRDVVCTWATLNSSVTKEVNFKATFIEPGYQIFSRLETNGVGNTHHAIVAVFLRRLLS